MRYLLKEDLEKYNSIKNWVKENWDKRTPDLTKEKQKFVMQFSIRDLDMEILTSKLRGFELQELDIIKRKANSKPEFVVHDISCYNESRTKGYKTFFGDAYFSNKDFLDNYAEIKYFDKLQELASKYLDSLGYYDNRNFYEENGTIYHGIREQNKYDARLLGDVVSGTFVMSSKEYNSILIKIKNENKNS